MASGVRLVLCLSAAAALLQLCSSLPVDSREQKMRSWKKMSGEKGVDFCVVCEAAVTILKAYLETNSSINEIYPAVEPFCVYFMEKVHGYDGAYMCPGIIFAYGPVVLYVIAEGALNPSDICYLLHLCNSSATDESQQPSLPSLPSLSSLPAYMKHLWTQPSLEMTVAGRADKPVHLASPADRRHSRGGDRRGGKKESETDTIMFVQVSDIHLDQLFAEGSPSMCKLYLCCRSWYNGTAPAGHYGDFNCDLPLVTLDLVVEAISQLDPQPDFIVYTGDNSPHDPWNETWASQNEASEYLISYLAQKLPDRYIYPALGNHETLPESEYVGSLPQYQEWTRQMAKYWEMLLPLPQSAVETISDGAYYTLLVQDKLRILSFNSDYGYSINFYTTLNKDNVYYTRQQQWMLDTLVSAEKAGEKVMIIAHIPPGDPGNTLVAYEEFYLNITRRYRDTIVAHLFGHTHHDEFKLVQDDDGVYGTLLICPSVTPYGRSNPSFRLFTMDATSYQLTGYQQYHLNLSLANEMAKKGEKPKLELAYTTSDLYDLPDLSPSSWAGLVERFSNYPELVSQYRYNVYGRTSSHDLSCDSQCVHQTICEVSNILNKERAKCNAGF